MVELARELNRHAASATHEQTHLAEHPGQLVWIFMGMSVVGLMGETLQHLVAFGELESRAGFIWGPFSPIYGLAAVLLTMLLEPLQDKGVPLLLTVSAVVGGSLEYFASWAMETFWGVVAWSYLNIPLNFDGRTDVFHCLIWGTIGVLWVKVGLQLCQRIFNRVNTTGAPYRAATAALSIFMALDIAMTIIVLLRADARTDGIPPQNPIEQFCDTAYLPTCCRSASTTWAASAYRQEKGTGARFPTNEQGPACDAVRKRGLLFLRYGISGNLVPVPIFPP